MKLSDFDYNYPKTLIAKYPAEPRDSARLMVVDRNTGDIEHRRFTDIHEYFRKGDCLVLNDTKVFPARLFGRKEKTNAKIEVFLLRELSKDEHIWDVIVDPARKVRIGNKIYFSDNLMCEVIDNTTSRGRTVKFNYEGDFFKIIEDVGNTPLPPYIKRDAEEEDKARYQTVFAENIGAVAAPTAGLHFTKPLLSRLKRKGVSVTSLLLHIGLGTFRPVEVEDLTKHKMDSEYYEIPPEACMSVNKAKDAKKNIFVCGTSTVRAAESSVTTMRKLTPARGWTDKFIFPPYDFKVTDKLITNFHMPKTTLLMMVAAFMDYDLMMKAYKKAVKERYRLFSYGDAMIIL
ncbi:MAG: tRNA preQ1(34) S-adenosylmethionine ribosyltransferase-isomerase QueA [Ectothiorhodospiraceae bacterium]|nr:tRNA preQ1(34) S-adenosylmethionine ribosyltransferase-isomerase QueA [Ectothiorhodospiraceae bacterium]